jgi:hypothetical protein
MRGGEGRKLPYCILSSDAGVVMGECGSGVSADCRGWGPSTKVHVWSRPWGCSWLECGNDFALLSQME